MANARWLTSVMTQLSDRKADSIAIMEGPASSITTEIATTSRIPHWVDSFSFCDAQSPSAVGQKRRIKGVRPCPLLI